jgi:hypothetical protein
MSERTMATTRGSTMRRIGLLLLGGLLAGVACTDLHLENLNQPDRRRALAEPADVEALIGTTFVRYFQGIHSTSGTHGVSYQAYLMPAVGNEATTHILYGGVSEIVGQHPRARLRNDPAMPAQLDPTGPLDAWRILHEVVSSANEGLFAINEGMRFMDGGRDETMRAKAFAKFMQGLSWGHMAITWDRVTLIDEHDDLPAGQVALYALVTDRLRPYPEAVTKAIAALDEAIAIAEQHAFVLPPAWTRNDAGDVTSADLIRIANSYAAKFMVYAPRTPEERAQVDWNEVLRRTDLGVTEDFGPRLASGTAGVSSRYWSVLQSAGGVNHRMHYDVIGPADQSGAYQVWLSTPFMERDRFDILTPDRRVTGVDAADLTRPDPQTPGAYITYREHNNGFSLGRPTGLALFSAYQWFRQSGAAQAGAVPLMGVDENMLLRAEALYRLGRLDEAAAAVNHTRTRPHEIVVGNSQVEFAGLPPVTAAGVPTDENGWCVPRTATGACGTLFDALVYERRLELAGVDFVRSWADNRGFGVLDEATFIQLPVPGRELLTLRLENYTYGGVGGNCAVGSTCEISPLLPFSGGSTGSE